MTNDVGLTSLADAWACQKTGVPIEKMVEPRTKPRRSYRVARANPAFEALRRDELLDANMLKDSAKMIGMSPDDPSNVIADALEARHVERWNELGDDAPNEFVVCLPRPSADGMRFDRASISKGCGRLSPSSLPACPFCGTKNAKTEGARPPTILLSSMKTILKGIGADLRVFAESC